MKAVQKTVVEVLVLGAIGIAVALTANGVRGSSGLKLNKNYFYKGEVRKKTQPEKQAVETTGAQPSAPSVQRSVLPLKQAATKHLDHRFQEVSFAEAVAIFEDPNTELGVNIFVDARNDAAYEEGHIPGALQVDHYRLEDYIDNILDYAQGAEKIVVYCNGGNCEDSILVCADLEEFEVEYESIYLFAGGWKAWTGGNMPVATGRDGE